jgi:hypothetical protein
VSRKIVPPPAVTMRRALSDPAMLGTVLVGDSWLAWRILLVAAMGESLTDDERVIFTRLTGREREPDVRVESLWAAVGRRGGKSRAIATLIVFIATLVDHSKAIVTGEKPIVLCLAPTARQARVVLDYISGIIESTPLLAPLIVNKTAETLELSNNITIEVRPATLRGTRGFSTVAVVVDEIAFLRSDESANPDSEILKALRPSLATTGGLLACISSPYAKRGELYTTFRKHYGPDGDPLILVAKAPSWETNPSLSRRVIDRAYEDDATAAAAEYGGEFRADIEAFVSREVVEGCVIPGVLERPPASSVSYQAFVDPSGGSSDSMTLCVGHKEGDTIVIDAIREPFSPDDVVGEFSALLKSYGVSKVVGDRYAGAWPQERFRERSITYEPSAKAKSDLYVALLATLNSARIELPDDKRLVSQLCGLERRTARRARHDRPFAWRS